MEMPNMGKRSERRAKAKPDRQSHVRGPKVVTQRDLILRGAEQFVPGGRMKGFGTDGPGFDQALEELAPTLTAMLGHERHMLYQGILEMAGMAFTYDLLAPTGHIYEARTQTFVMPVHGSMEGLDRLRRDDEAWLRLTRSFKESGLFHDESSVVLASIGLEADEVGMGPGMMSAIAKSAFWTCFNEGKGDLKGFQGSIVDIVIGDRPYRDAVPGEVGSKGIVGAHFSLARKGTSPALDHLSRLAATPGWEMFDRAGTSASWLRLAGAVLKPFGLVPDLPDSYSDALVRFAMERVRLNNLPSIQGTQIEPARNGRDMTIVTKGPCIVTTVPERWVIRKRARFDRFLRENDLLVGGIH